MPYQCPNCGERDDFIADASCDRSYRARGSVTINTNGEWSDFEENDGDDYETNDMDYENVRCGHCDAHATWCETEEEAEALCNGTMFSRILQAHNFSSGSMTSLNY
ncbi:MAG: hypothetical protein KAS17_06275 [Victivallaceae bacterium]|nr:hypothetical protein [Victivallaceae bacterium]